MSTRTQYEADLAALKGSLAKMSQLSADAVEDALEALCTADAEEAKGIIKGDTEVNRMERDIEHRCMTLQTWSASVTMPPTSRRSSPIWPASARRATPP